MGYLRLEIGHLGVTICDAPCGLAIFARNSMTFIDVANYFGVTSSPLVSRYRAICLIRGDCPIHRMVNTNQCHIQATRLTTRTAIVDRMLHGGE